MAASASFSSLLGNWVEGLTSATTGFSGRGGTMVLTTVFFPAQITTVGSGISTLSARGLGISGCTSVCAPRGACTTIRKAGGGASGLAAGGDACAFAGACA